MGKRWIAALAALFMLAGFLSACGDDDDDDVASDDTEEMTDDGGEESGGVELDEAMATVCSDTGQADDGILTPEEAGELAAQAEAVTDPPAEIADAIAGAGEYFRMLEEAGEDVAVEDVQLSEHLIAVNEWCTENVG